MSASEAPPPRANDLRVLVVARWYPAHDNPGSGSFVADSVEALSQVGVDVTVASWESTPFGASRRARRNPAAAATTWSAAWRIPDVLNIPRSWGAHVPVARLPAFRMVGMSNEGDGEAHAATLLPFGRALAKSWPFDVIHAHTALPDGLAALRLAQDLRLPLLVSEHDRSLRYRLPASAEARAAYRRLLRQADATVAVSHGFAALLIRELGERPDALGVLPNAVPAIFFGQPLDGPRDAHELLYVGGRRENKGIPVLLEAFARTRAADPRLHLRLIGRSDSPAEDDHWRGVARTLGVAHAVAFDPPADRAAVARAMAGAGALVQASPFESFGMIVAEALACGLPVAATRSGVEEIIGDGGEFGEVADGVDAESLAAAILRLRERRGAFDAERLREHARGRFEASAIAARTVDRYRSLIQGRRSGPRRGQPHRPDSRQPAPSTFRAPLVVGLRPHTAHRRLAALDSRLAAQLAVVTGSEGPADAGAAPLAGAIRIDVEADYRAQLESLGGLPAARASLIARVARFARSPRKTLARRRVIAARDDLVRATARREVHEAWKRLSDEEGASRSLLPLDGDDLLAAADAVAAGAELTPASTRWLADRWDAMEG